MMNQTCFRRFFYVVMLLFISIVSSVDCFAQDTLIAPATKQEIWPEINLYYRFNDRFRLYSSISATKLKTSSYTDGGLSVNMDYFAFPQLRKMHSKADSSRGHLLLLRAGFIYSASPPASKDELKEYTVNTEASLRFYLPYDLLLTNKNRFDWRFLNGAFQPRYRSKLTLERDFKTDYLRFNLYTYAEYFLNFNSTKHNRFRFSLGNELMVSKHINIEVYYVHQFDNGLSSPTVNAIGLALKIFLHKGDHLFERKITR